MERTVDVAQENNMPLPTKEAYLTEIKKLDLNIPAKFQNLILPLDVIAGAFFERRVVLGEVESRAKTMIESSVTNLETAFSDAQAREAEDAPPEAPRYDPHDPESRTVEEAQAELGRLQRSPEYWNEDGKVPSAEHERLVNLGNRLREIINGRTTTLRGYVDEVSREREERHVAAYGSRESKRSASRSVGSTDPMMGEGAD